VTDKATITETELIQGLRSHSHEAFAALYDNYAPTLLGIIFTIVKNKEEAENLLQDSFVKIWKNILQYNPEKGRLFTWLITICRNTSISHLRTQGKKTPVEIQLAESSVYTEGKDAIGDGGLKKLVFQLEPIYREVIHLIYFFGYTQQEVSEILKLPLGTVKTRTRMALQLLRKQCAHD
jgi:RNA polymerase sigma-70 factor, ECF subfamily